MTARRTRPPQSWKAIGERSAHQADPAAPQRRAGAGSPAAIEQAQGRFIAFLDSDDLWLPAKLERQIAFAQNNRAALSYTAFRRINETGTVTGRLIEVPASLNYEQLLKNTSIATLTALVDRDIAGNIAMKNAPYDDFCLWLSILKPGHVAYGLNEDLARYRVRGSSISSRPMPRPAASAHLPQRRAALAVKSAWCFAHWSAQGIAEAARILT